MWRMAVVVLAMLAGCASAARSRESTFEPVGAGEYKYAGPYHSVFFPLNGEGDAYRKQQLQDWLEENGLCRDGYEVLDKQVVKVSDFAGGKVVERIRCK